MLAAAAAALFLVVAAPPSARTPPVTEVLDASGHVQRVISRPTAFTQTGARWSPDGTQIAWLDEQGLNVSSADGSNARVLVPKVACDNDQCLGGLSFAWSPDGTRLLVGGVGHWTNRLVVVDVATGETSDIAKATRYSEYWNVAWAPNGKHISYLRETGHAGHSSCCTADLVVAGPDGTHAHVLYRAREAIKDGPLASWSSDSRTLAFTTQHFDLRDPAFAFVDSVTGRVRQVKLGSYAGPFYWSPDGTRVAVRTPTGVDVVSRRGAVRPLHFVGTVLAWTKPGLLLAKTFDQPRSVWISKDGRGTPRLAFRVPDGRVLYQLDARA